MIILHHSLGGDALHHRKQADPRLSGHAADATSWGENCGKVFLASKVVGVHLKA